MGDLQTWSGGQGMICEEDESQLKDQFWNQPGERLWVMFQKGGTACEKTWKEESLQHFRRTQRNPV